MHGFFGRVLHVDVGSGRGVYEELSESLVREYLGGVGLGTLLLFEWAPPGVDPLSPASPLVITTAPLAGTPIATTAKFAVAAKSPLTGFVADSLSSGHFALALKGLAVDALVVTGRAAALAYLSVDGGRIELRDAGHLAGLASADVESAIRTELSCSSASVASIGVAGERCVRFATISSEGRHAGRGGLGAVMGAKNLKAIVLRGGERTRVARQEEVDALAAVLRRRMSGPVMDTHRRIGTVANVSVFDRLGALPTRNFREATCDASDALSGEALAETSFSYRRGCASCAIRCEHRFRSRHTEAQRLEYETVFALGTACGVGDPDCVIDAAALCDRCGLDAISTGGTVAWAMEAAERGVLPRAASRGLRFGDGHALLSVIPAIAAREGIGDLLAEGSRRAAAATGRGSGAWAMHVKGLELPGYEPRRLHATALGLAVSPSGPCHNRSGVSDVEASPGSAGPPDPSLGSLVAAAEDRAAVLDSLIVCRFARRCLLDFFGETAEILSAVTGWTWTAAEVEAVGDRIVTTKKLFNIREGWLPHDDWLPERLLTEPLATGPCRGTGLSPEALHEMIRGYYRARQWNERGYVPGWKSDRLGCSMMPTAP